MAGIEFTKEDMERFEHAVREGIATLLLEVGEAYKNDPQIRQFTPHLATVIVVTGVRGDDEAAIKGDGAPVATLVKTVSAFDTLWVLAHGLAHVANARVMHREPLDIPELDRPASD